MRLLLTLLCLALALPVLGVLGSWFVADAGAWQILLHQARTVLPDYTLQSLLLSTGVAVGVVLVGAGAAAAVSLFEFPGRRSFEWALLLPLAMPAYVLAYAWTDALQYSSPLQEGLRKLLGVRGALWPDIRSLWGAVLLFVLCLYPYVYLLARTALGERAVQLLEAARLLGAGPRRRILEVALPLARPAIAAGVALALMETLADYGVSAYFGLSTFSAGIYKAWLVMNDGVAAAQLASALLLVVGLLLAMERAAQRRLRFSASRSGAMHSADARPLRLRGRAAVLAWLLCALPVVLGFVLPVAWLAWMLWQEAHNAEFGLPLARFAQWSWSTLRLGLLAAVLASTLALAVSFMLRRGGGRALSAAARVLALGYAMPGAVLAVGILIPVGWVQQRWPEAPLASLVTGTIFGLMYAYLARFSSVAMQSVESGYARVPISVDETARMLGAGAWRVLLRLHAPLLRRSALAAMLLVLVDTMKELPATLVLRPFGSDTLAVVAFNFARDERLGEAALPSLAIVLVGLIPVIMLSRALRGSAEQAGAVAPPAGIEPASGA
ncbi:MAG: iron ABC transporter permease [Burkholderiales bacterium]|nr:iron ABC transporter permease [Burkholderiales bacterium]